MLSVLLVVLGAQFFGLGLLGEFLAHGNNAPRDDLAESTRDVVGLGPEYKPLEA